MSVVAIDASADQNCMRVDMEKGSRMYSIYGSMVSRGKNVGLQGATEKPRDGLPAFHFSVASNQIGKPTGAEPCDLHHDAAIVRRIHVLDMRREKFEAEIAGE